MKKTSKKKKIIEVDEIEVPVYNEEVYEQTVSPKVKITLLTQNFGSEEIHILRDKINEIITCLNS